MKVSSQNSHKDLMTWAKNLQFVPKVSWEEKLKRLNNASMIHDERLVEIIRIERRCSYHELKCVIGFVPEEEKEYRIKITDKRFFSIDARFSGADFDENIKSIDSFIDSWIILNEMN